MLSNERKVLVLFVSSIRRELLLITCNCPWSGLSLFQSLRSSASKRCSCTLWLNSKRSRWFFVLSWNKSLREAVMLLLPLAVLRLYKEPSLTMLSTRFIRGFPFSYWSSTKKGFISSSRFVKDFNVNFEIWRFKKFFFFVLSHTLSYFTCFSRSIRCLFNSSSFWRFSKRLGVSKSVNLAYAKEEKNLLIRE